MRASACGLNYRFPDEQSLPVLHLTKRIGVWSQHTSAECFTCVFIMLYLYVNVIHAVISTYIAIKTAHSTRHEIFTGWPSTLFLVRWVFPRNTRWNLVCSHRPLHSCLKRQGKQDIWIDGTLVESETKTGLTHGEENKDVQSICLSKVFLHLVGDGNCCRFLS